MRDRVALINLEHIRTQAPHHLYRYLYALPMVRSPVLDAACGVGYGSYVMAEHGHMVTAVDIAQEATSFGRTYYGSPNIHWITADMTLAPWGWETYKTIVSFETLEHLPNPLGVLKDFHRSLDGDGKLICSVPNEEQYPFNPKNFEGEQYPHIRHYTPQEFEQLLNSAGFDVIHRGTQLSKKQPHVVTGSGGIFLVYTAVKKPRVALAA